MLTRISQISAAFYSHRNYRLVTIIRGSLVTTIYRKEISLTAFDNSAAVMFMSTDVERIVNGLRMMHEFWADLVHVSISTYLLQRNLGVACVAPIVVSICGFPLSPWFINDTLADSNLVSAVGTFCLSSTAGEKQSRVDETYSAESW